MAFVNTPRDLRPDQAANPVPPEIIQAVLKRIASRLQVDFVKAALVVRGITGKSVDFLTWGDLRFKVANVTNMDRAIVHPRINIDTFDIGLDATTSLCVELAFFHPTIAPCDKCGEVSVTEHSSQVCLKDEGECPHCGQGIIRMIKMKESYVRCTDLTVVSWATAEDHDSNPYQPLPTRNDWIWAKDGDPKHWLKVDPQIREALVNEKLLDEDGEPDVAKFIAWLIHAHDPGKYRGPKKYVLAYQDLEQKKLLGAATVNALLGMVAEAKAWTPSEEVPAKKNVPPADIVLVGNTPSAQLTSLLKQVFTPDEMRMFLTNCFENGQNLLAAVPQGSSSPDIFFYELVHAMKRYGDLDTHFFRELAKARPAQRAVIDRLAQLQY